MTERKTSERKASSLFKKFQTLLYNGSDTNEIIDNYENPSLTQYNFGNIELYKNELNISDELKKYIRYIVIPYYNKDSPGKLNSKQFKFYKSTLTSTPITDAKTFQSVVIKYNTFLTDDECFFINLKAYEKKYPEEAKTFFNEILPFIIEQALKLPEYLTKPIPLLGKYMNIAITLNKLQVLSLLANQFLCIFNEDNHALYDTPPCSFITLLSPLKLSCESTVEKIRCIIHYFDKMRKRDLEKIKSELLTYQRVSLDKNSLPDWKNEKANLCGVIIDPERHIEDCDNMLQVDFANWYLGGGVLNDGCVQEEIRFCINPELFVSMIFSQRMYPLECSFIMGTERFSNYEGYRRSFKYSGDFDDESSPLNRFHRKTTDIVAVDASFFTPPCTPYYYNQFSSELVQNELIKFYAAAKRNEYSDLEKDACVATGNWGCGAFNGNIELKALIQVIAVSATEKSIYYCPFENIKFAEQFGTVLKKLKTHHITSDILYNYIENYYTDIISKITSNDPPNITLFNYILEKLQNL